MKDNKAWFANHLSLLQRQAELWKDQNRKPGLLLSGKDLLEADEWAKGHRERVLPHEDEFLADCWELQERAGQEQRRKRLTIMVAMASIVALVAIGFGIVAVRQSLQARQQAFEAQVSQISAQALANQNKQYDLALLLGAEAFGREDNFQTRSTLLDMISYSPRMDTFLFGHTSDVTSVAFSPDGKTLASASDDGTILLWEVSSHQQVGELVGHSEAVLSVAFSPDGSMLASGSAELRSSLWDLAPSNPSASLSKGMKIM